MDKEPKSPVAAVVQILLVVGVGFIVGAAVFGPPSFRQDKPENRLEKNEEREEVLGSLEAVMKPGEAILVKAGKHKYAVACVETDRGNHVESFRIINEKGAGDAD